MCRPMLLLQHLNEIVVFSNEVVIGATGMNTTIFHNYDPITLCQVFWFIGGK